MVTTQKISPSLWFAEEAEDAASFYKKLDIAALRRARDGS
jgi:predicted 3-demethylubiquinone-9 3-methyltransferase (glyoxalase superfamily)